MLQDSDIEDSEGGSEKSSSLSDSEYLQLENFQK